MPEENKRKFALWIHPDTQDRVKELYKKDNCKSQSEFIEKAVRFYCGYVSSDSGMEFLPTAITTAMAGIVETSENRMARLLFKLAVEMSMMMNVLADTTEMGESYLRGLRGRCVDDVKKSLGAVTFDEVVKKQSGQ